MDVDDSYFLISNSFNFIWVWNGYFNNTVTILRISVKLTTLGPLKINVLWIKGYGVIITVHKGGHITKV